ncbi:MAG TPA: hypothetical protein VMB20_03780 [Candidatus Acidoferrum sp.]|nr:hypothetical protein [Candidatus Acidoferrum sp.]
MKLLATLLCAALLAAAPAATGANLTLASSLIASGGGPGSYSTVRAFDAMIGADAVLTNQRQLTTNYGQTNADQFVHMFDYAIADAWQLAGKDNISIPPPAQTGGQALATQLVQAGVTNGGITFDNDTFFTQLFGAKIAGQVQNDINAKYGAGAWTNFSRMSDQFFHNIGQTVGMNV